jgi:hypothetical protein
MTERKRPIHDTEEYYGIKILKDATWLYLGSPITRHNLVKLFASVLKRDAAGAYWLETPYERGRIEVEDVPFAAVEMRVESSGKSQKLFFRTNLDEWVAADAAHALRIDTDETGTVTPYIHVRDGLDARLTRAVYYELAALAADGGDGIFGVYSHDLFFPVGRAA